MRVLVGLVLVACGPGRPAPALSNAVAASPPPPLSLPMTEIRDEIGELVDARLFSTCQVATRVELRTQWLPTGSHVCTVGLRRGDRTTLVATGLFCRLYGQPVRATFAATHCEHDTLTIGLVLAGARVDIACTSGACTREPTPPPDDPVLDAFVGEVARAIRTHRWHDLLARCDADHRALQLGKMQMRAPTYVAEILGLHYADNTIGEVDGVVTLDRLAQIADVTIGEVARQRNGTITVLGWVRLVDGTHLRMTLTIVKRASGTYALAG